VVCEFLHSVAKKVVVGIVSDMIKTDYKKAIEKSETGKVSD